MRSVEKYSPEDAQALKWNTEMLLKHAYSFTDLFLCGAVLSFFSSRKNVSYLKLDELTGY